MLAQGSCISVSLNHSEVFYDVSLFCLFATHISEHLRCGHKPLPLLDIGAHHPDLRDGQRTFLTIIFFFML
jgi:hypothetical protein